VTGVSAYANGPLRIGALFAGYGGLELAVHDVLDVEPAWVVEFDKGPSAILAHHWPDVPNLHDVTKVDWSTVEPVDIITGGSPCQDLSHAGKRQGMKAGTRSGLWASMCDAIETIRPRLVVWENVRGALSAAADSAVEPCPFCVGDDPGVSLRALGRVLGDLAELGYDAAWHGLRAADVGAPHGRWRVFVLAWRQDDHEPIEARPGTGRMGGDAAVLSPLPSPRTSDTNGPGMHGAGGMDLRTAVSLLPTPRATDGTNGGPNQRGSSGDLMLPSAVHLLPTPAVNDMGASYTPETWDAWTARMKAEHGNGNGHGNSLHVEALRLMPTPTTEPTTGNGHARNLGAEARLLPMPTSTDHKGSGSAGYAKTDTHNTGTTLTDATVRQPEAWGQYAAAIARWEALTRPAPSPTEPTGKAGAHRLSPAFVEWLMGLPAGWVTDPAIWSGWKPGAARNAQLKALGNGVVPQQCAAALRHLLTVRNNHLEKAA